MEYTFHDDQEHSAGYYDSHTEQPGGALVGVAKALREAGFIVGSDFD